MADDGPGVLPFVRGIDLSRNDFHVSSIIVLCSFFKFLKLLLKEAITVQVSLPLNIIKGIANYTSSILFLYLHFSLIPINLGHDH